MSTVIPSEVLSEHFQHRMRGRRLVAAVFLTFQFDPGFFEQEILPALFDIPVSHAKKVRLVQLEGPVLAVKGGIAVYYDASGIVSSDAGGPKLDVKRIPIQQAPFCFHPKNVFLLVESDGDDPSSPVRSLLVASMSANLTRSGWWENVEVCHVEEVAASAPTRLRDDLLAFLKGIRKKAPASVDQSALAMIEHFVRGAEQRVQRTYEGVLHTHFFHTGITRSGLPDFLESVAGTKLQGCYLEVISPFFDDNDSCEPLADLIARFQPKEVRVFLPRGSSGEALCRKEIYQDVRSQPNTTWGKLPHDVTRMGRKDETKERYVHAKIYRFFSQNPKREIYLVGSANLTRAAHADAKMKNVESGFLVEVIPSQRPSFWLDVDKQAPADFRAETEAGQVSATPGTPLNLSYDWQAHTAQAYWDATTLSPTLRLEVEGRGVPLGTVGPLPPREWVTLSVELADALRGLLPERALVLVHGVGDVPALMLVQEQNLQSKPSVLLQLSASDILRYWALLTAEQRSAFIEARAPEIALTAEGTELIARTQALVTTETFFDRFAGFFHAFACLERAVRTALDGDNARHAAYRLFGERHDSLAHLLERVLQGDEHKPVDQYVIVLCARQLCNEIKRDFPEFWKANRLAVKKLEGRFVAAGAIRSELEQSDPDSMPAFLTWFDQWFLKRAKPRPEVVAS